MQFWRGDTTRRRECGQIELDRAEVSVLGNGRGRGAETKES